MTNSKGWAGARERLAQRPDEVASSEVPSGESPPGFPADAPPEAEPAPEPAVQSGGTAEAPAEVDALVREAEADIADDVDELERLAAERDDYMERLQRLQADFANYRKRVMRQQTEHLERAAQDLVAKLLEVLDNFDLALAHGASEHVEPIYRSLLGVLEATGLERIDPTGQPFDPTEHDAVQHEAGDGTPEVVEVLRAGYRWKGRVLRPAMVKVKG